MDYNNYTPPPRSSDHMGHKANFDANEQKQLQKGRRGLWYDLSNWLIVIGIIAFIYLLIRIF